MKNLLLTTAICSLLSFNMLSAKNIETALTVSEDNNNLETSYNSPFQIITLQFSTSNNSNRQLILGFSDQTTDGFDYGYDSEMGTFYDNDFASLLDNNKMAIQAFSEIQADKQIRFALNSDASFSYTISIANLDNIDDSQDIYLYDSLENVHHNLRASDYNFTAAAGEDMTRFKLTFNSSGFLSTIDESIENVSLFVANNTNTLFAKGLNDDIKTIEIVNVLGQTVRRFSNLKQKELQAGLALQNYNSGMYIITMQLDNGAQVSKKVLL